MATLDPDQILLSAVTFGEIQRGIEITRGTNAAKSKEIEEWLDLGLAAFTVLPMDGEAFREHARLVHGKSRAAYDDVMIAATARVRALTVATRNLSDFQDLKVKVYNPFEYKD